MDTAPRETSPHHFSPTAYETTVTWPAVYCRSEHTVLLRVLEDLPVSCMLYEELKKKRGNQFFFPPLVLFFTGDIILKLWWIRSFPFGSFERAVVGAAAHETRGASHVFSTCCGPELTAGRTESRSGVMLPSLLLLLLLLQLLALVALATSVLSVSGSVLFLALFLPCPIQQPVDRVTVPRALHASPATSPHSSNPRSSPRTPKPTASTQGHALGRSGSAVKADVLQLCMEVVVVVVVSLEPVELKCRSSRL